MHHIFIETIWGGQTAACAFETDQSIKGCWNVVEPAPSELMLMGVTPAATRAADPPDDPPAVRAKSQGFRVIINLFR